MKYIVSIDPGVTGAISIIERKTQKLIYIYDLSKDLHETKDIFSEIYGLTKGNTSVVIEGLPEVKSERSYKENFELYKSAASLKAFSVSFLDYEPLEIPPSKWKIIIPSKYLDLSIKCEYRRRKEASRQYALSLTKDKGGDELFKLKKHHDRAESFLLGVYWITIDSLRRTSLVS